MHDEGGSNTVVKAVIGAGLFCMVAFWAKRWIEPSAPQVAPPTASARRPEPPPPPPPQLDDGALKMVLLGERKDEEQKKAPRPRRAPRQLEAEQQEPQPMAEELAEPSLSEDGFKSAIDGWRGVKSCLATNPNRAELDHSGALKVSLKITTTGEVVESRVYEESNEVARRISPCVERAARKIRFPAFAGADVVRDAKFVF